MRQRESLVDVLGLLVRHRRLWLGIIGAAFVLSLAVAFLSPVYYTATTTFLAASPDLNNASKLFAGEQLELYGTGDDVERVIAAAESEETVKFLIDSFDLYEVYEVDTAARYASTKVRDELYDHYTVRRTKYDEVEIFFEDQDPRRAATLANAARDRAGQVVQETAMRGQRETHALFTRAIGVKRQRLREITDSLNSLNTQFGVLDARAQGEQFSGLRDYTNRLIVEDSIFVQELARKSLSGRMRDTLMIVQARLEGSRVNREVINRQLLQYTSGSAKARTLTSENEILNEQLGFDLERIRRIESVMASPGPVIYVSNAARVPDRKSRPVRSLIVLGITLAAAILSAVGIILWDTYKAVDWKRYARD